MIKGVLFDLDGTLVDTSKGIMESVRYTLRALKLPELPVESLLKFVGPPIQNSFIDFLGLSTEEAQNAANIFRDYYKSKALFEADVYSGIFELLDYLKHKDIKIGIATYKREDYAKQLLDYLNISPYCDVIHGGDNENRLRKSDIVALCCGELGCGLSELVLVGDTVHDAEGARQAGISFIAVTWGFGYKKKNVATMTPPFIGVVNAPLEIKTMLCDQR